MITPMSAEVMASPRRWHLLILFLLTQALAAFGQTSPPEFRLEAGLISLNVHDTPLVPLIESIGEQAGFSLVVTGDLDTRVSLNADSLPLEQALETLLAQTDRITTYAPPTQETGAMTRRKRIVSVWLFAPGTTLTGDPQSGPETSPWSEDDRTRSHDVLRLSREGSVDGDSMELLTQALEDDPAPLVRSRAAMALGKLGDTEAVPALASALGDSNSTVRTQSVHALAQIGGDRALAVLGDTLLSHHDPRTRQLAALALRREGSDQAMVYLQAAASETGVVPTGVSIPTVVPETGAVDR